MRVLIGLAALAASVQAQTNVVWSGPSTGASSSFPGLGQTALAGFQVYQTFVGNTAAGVSPSLPSYNPAAGSAVNYLQSQNYAVTVNYPVSTIAFSFTTNVYTAQMQYRWAPNYTPGQLYTCDICAGGTTTSCNTATGPGTGASPVGGFPCANIQARTYTMSGLVANTPAQGFNSGANSFSVEVLDRQTAPGPNVSSYSFVIVRGPPPIIGDPQIYGLQGQDFQVHGVPDEIFNMITYPNLQVNARFVYLSAGECLDNYTACFAHPGTYISEEGIRLGSDKIHVRAGAAKKGLSVSVNGKKLASGKQAVKLGSVELVNHRRVVITTPIMSIALTNSDKFLNQESSLFDRKLLALGAERRVMKDGQQFHSEVPLHGLQGQTWRNVEYPSGLEYEGSISDYQIQDGNLWGTNFVFNQYQA